ncbi:MAG: hypothetical protein U0744_07675 [Gemmataceae bacterium]
MLERVTPGRQQFLARCARPPRFGQSRQVADRVLKVEDLDGQREVHVEELLQSGASVAQGDPLLGLIRFPLGPPASASPRPIRQAVYSPAK